MDQRLHNRAHSSYLYVYHHVTTACCTAWSSGLSFFCLITELLLSLANHAKVVTESVLFQKISTSHRKRCQNEQEGKDYLKAKHILNLVKWTETRTGTWLELKITCFAKFGEDRSPGPHTRRRPWVINFPQKTENWE